MCGIIGGYGENVESEWIATGTQKLARRGPDFQADLRVSKTAHFGSARLAMTDPHQRSNQPFCGKNSIIVFNGEIYNHKYLKKQLEQEGIFFDTESDTEVLLKCLDFWGVDANEKIEGMYAFVYLNLNDNSLIMGRDPLGKKPLYYSIHNETIHWSSSLKTMQILQDWDGVSPESTYEYLTLGYSVDPGSFAPGIAAVPAGYFIKINSVMNKLQELQFIKTPVQRKITVKKLDFREILKAAVVARVDGHDSVAISLSGGIDSAIIALLASETNAKIKAYSACWPDSDKERYNNDSRRARVISQNLGIEHEEVEVFNVADLDSNLRAFVIAMEEPNSNPSGLAMMNLYKKIGSEGQRLVLTGDGADEILAGYPRHQSLARVPNLLNWNSVTVSRMLEHERNHLNSNFFRLLVSQSSNRNFDNWLHWHWNFTPTELEKLAPKVFSKANSGHLRRKFEFVEPRFEENPISFNMQMDRSVWLNMESNRKLDRISMYYSIEARSPFQDENVIDFSISYMKETKYKILGKKLLWDSFPEIRKIGAREDKAGFISPVGHWLRGNPRLVSDSLQVLQQELPLNSKMLESLAQAPLKGHYRDIMKLWSLVVLSYWIQENR